MFVNSRHVVSPGVIPAQHGKVHFCLFVNDIRLISSPSFEIFGRGVNVGDRVDDNVTVSVGRGVGVKVEIGDGAYVFVGVIVG